MSEIALGECCDSCGEAGHMLSDPRMRTVGQYTYCGDCFRELHASEEETEARRDWIAAGKPAVVTDRDKWFCPYCGKELADKRSPHCGEIGHAVDETEINRMFGDR